MELTLYHVYLPLSRGTVSIYLQQTQHAIIRRRKAGKQKSARRQGQRRYENKPDPPDSDDLLIARRSEVGTELLLDAQPR
eukprot:scaffold1634_cov118-Skeletonema_dohrnii-CCMP3373.AAC.4